MKRSEAYISKREHQVIKRKLKKAACRHQWKKFGYGYICRHCEYYTGMNTELNRIIRKELKES